MRKINTFWNWFQDNNQTIKNLINETPINQKNCIFWLNKHLHYYCNEIDFILVFPKKTNEKTELIITANGNPDYFKKINELIDHAPSLRTWKFIAFIQPMEDIDRIIEKLDSPYIFKDITIKASEIMFLPLNCDENFKKLDIIVYLKNYNIQCDTKNWKQALYFIMQNIFGEKLIYENINFVQLAQLPDNNHDLIYLYDLQSYLDTFKSILVPELKKPPFLGTK